MSLMSRLMGWMAKLPSDKQSVILRPPAFQAGCRGFASRGLAPCIRLWRQKRARSASLALPAASQGVPTFWPPPAQIQACHLLLQSPLQARAGLPR